MRPKNCEARSARLGSSRSYYGAGSIPEAPRLSLVSGQRLAA